MTPDRLPTPPAASAFFAATARACAPQSKPAPAAAPAWLYRSEAFAEDLPGWGDTADTRPARRPFRQRCARAARRQRVWSDATVAVTLALAVTLLTGCGPLPAARGQASTGSAEPAESAEAVAHFGALELVTHRRREPANDAGATAHDLHWSLRWQGQPLTIDTRTGMWGDQPTRARTVHAVYTVGAAASPDLLVLVGDPNNTGAYHLLYPQDGRLHTPLVCPVLAGDSRITRLDSAGTVQPSSAPQGGPEHRQLTGARWLMLGQRCVLDVRQRRAMSVPPSAVDGPTVMPSIAVHTLSPDGRSLARLGYQKLGGEQVHRVMVADLDGDRWTSLPIDRRRMRYDNPHAVDDAWLAHHFEWRRDNTGRDRLQARKAFKPLPWRGTVEPSGRAYVLHAARHDPAALLAGVLVRRFQGQPLPRVAGSTAQAFQVRGEPVTVDRAAVSAGGNGAYWPGQPGDPARSIALIHDIAQAIDEELATGRHDELFETAHASP
jgi:hypothetical protein